MHQGISTCLYSCTLPPGALMLNQLHSLPFLKLIYPGGAEHSWRKLCNSTDPQHYATHIYVLASFRNHFSCPFSPPFILEQLSQTFTTLFNTPPPSLLGHLTSYKYALSDPPRHTSLSATYLINLFAWLQDVASLPLFEVKLPLTDGIHSAHIILGPCFIYFPQSLVYLLFYQLILINL